MSDQQGLYTLAEASDLTGLSTEALRLRIKRGKLAAERGNDGQPRVRITDAEREDLARLVARRQSTLTRQAPMLTRQDADRANAIRVLEAAVDALRDQAGRERAALEAEAEALREAVGRERERADKAEGQAAAERARAGQIEAEREAARAETAAERTRAGQVEAEREAARAETAAERARAVQAEREREAAKVAAASAEAEAKGLREALAREVRQLEQAEADRRAAETQREAAQIVRFNLQAELAAWTAGGPVARAWRAFLNRRGGP